MKAAPHSSLSDQSLARLVLWAWLWLVRFACDLRAGALHPRTSLDAAARLVRNLIVIKAARIARLAPPRATPRRPLSAAPGFRRRSPRQSRALVAAAIGAKLRRRVRGRDLVTRLRALLSALFHIDALAAELAKRFKRRFTRLYPVVLVRPPALVVACAAQAPQPSAADTS